MAFIKKRRGRPRNFKPKVDKGTKELQQKRKILLEKGVLQKFSLAESLLGIFYANQVISQPLYEAGCFFGELGYRYELCLGHIFRMHASVLTSERDGHIGGLSDHQDEKRTRDWRNALAALQEAGPQAYKTVLNVVFYDQEITPESFPQSFALGGEPLRKGLDSLATYFKEGSKDKQGKPHGLVLSPLRATIPPPFLKDFQPHAPP